MFCPKCGSEYFNGSVYCGSCGEKIEPQQQNQSSTETNANNDYQQPYVENQVFSSLSPTEIAGAESKSRASLVLGILSLVLCWLAGVPGIILGSLAISNGIQARKVLNGSHYFYYNALAGIITGGIGLGLSIFFTIYWFAFSALLSLVSSFY
ncbi:MAG: hypothetical protein LBT30_07610 [Clostridiales bacterium]|jgi:hypothetical protein|nr:hypothetical protein [Clostridiales bacterium]